MVFLPLLVSQTTASFLLPGGTRGGLRGSICVQTPRPKEPEILPRVPHAECSQPFRVAQVLQQTPSPAGPMLHLSPTFASRDSQEKLEQFIRQFICG